MASNATTFDGIRASRKIDRLLTRMIRQSTAEGLSLQKEVNKKLRQENAEELQRQRIMMAELVLMWLSNQMSDCHPILRLLQNDSGKNEDQVFIKNATTVIHEHISDSSFGVKKFASEMAMSRSQLFRKFVAITGKAPSNFIRCIRLMRAANLIEQKFGNITEIALEVGYNNLAHFARCFRCHFGILPSEYAKRINRN